MRALILIRDGLAFALLLAVLFMICVAIGG